MREYLELIYNRLHNGTSAICSCDFILKKLQAMIDFPRPICYKFKGNSYLFLEENYQLDFLRQELNISEKLPAHIMESMMADKYNKEFEVIGLDFWNHDSI